MTERSVAREGLLQAGFVVLVWVALCGSHWSTDGLWFQGDAPRHAANGLFWRQLLQDLPSDPIVFALQYYARYPVTHLTSYPPLFHILEAGAFEAFGPAPLVAKAIVLGFALMVGLYTTAWIRRWIHPSAGWAGALVLTQSGMVVWSQAVMLNVPAFALMLAALYHAKRWLESSAPGPQLAIASVLLYCAIFVYYPAAIGVPIALAWALLLGQTRRLWSRGAAVAALAGFTLSLPATYVVMVWAPRIARWLMVDRLADIQRWLYYPTHLDQLVSPLVLWGAIVGAVVGIASRARRETGLLVAWIAITFVVLSFIQVQAERYMLPLVAPLLFLAVGAAASIVQRSARHLMPRARWIRHAPAVLLVALVAVEAHAAHDVRVPRFAGFREVASYLAEVAPREPVLYEGFHDGVFMFYMLAADPRLERGVVLARKVLPSALMQSTQTEPSELRATMELLRMRSGCQWIALEDSGQPQDRLAQRLLQAVQTADVERVRSFPIETYHSGSVHLYRWRQPVVRPAYLDLAFPDLGPDVRFSVEPIAPKLPQ